MDPLLYLKRVERNTFEPLVRFLYQFQVDLLVDFLDSLAVAGEASVLPRDPKNRVDVGKTRA